MINLPYAMQYLYYIEKFTSNINIYFCKNYFIRHNYYFSNYPNCLNNQ